MLWGDFIFILFILGFTFIAMYLQDNNRKSNSFIYCIKNINEEYKRIFEEDNFIYKITEIFLIVISEICSFICIYICILKFTYFYDCRFINILTKILIAALVFLIIHYVMGYILYLSSNINKFMFDSDEESLKGYFLLSYFITSIYFLILIIYPAYLKKYGLTALIGLLVTYILNFKIIFRVMSNPNKIKLSKNSTGGLLSIILAAILLVTLILINLYLGVCLVNVLQEAAYSNNPTFFDLFYYTIVTFTTIGFGDIIPLTALAKFMAVVISVTSIVCLTIFLGSILSFRKDKN